MYEKDGKQQKAVIDLFARYKKNRDNFSDDGVDIDHLTKQADILKENKYLLAIVGESKSGKSMFINALFEKPILPTGVLQCTSGIVEIIDTDNEIEKRNVYLKVKYASDQTPRIEFEQGSVANVDGLRERLKQISAVNDKYRSLPIHQLNQYLIEKRPQQITDEDIDILVQGRFVELDNPYRLSVKEFREEINRYLNEYKDLTKIATEICIGYPLGLKFTHMRIIDTPGVNARGGLKQQTIEYVETANAAIFIHTPKNIASESLRKFFTSAISKKARESIFMFLTHRAIEKKENVTEAVNEARRLFPEINPGRIIAVDSLLKQIYDELKSGKVLDSFEKDEEKWKLLASYILKYKGDVNRIKENVLEDSNFKKARKLLADFSEQSLGLQLREITTEIKKGYEEQDRYYKDLILLNMYKITKTPEQFNEEINTIKRELEKYEVLLYDFSQSKREEYTGLYSKVYVEFSTLRKIYNALIDKAENLYEVTKHAKDFNYEYNDRVTTRLVQLNNQYELEMKRIGAEFITKNIHPPVISVEDIALSAKERAYETVTIPGDVKQRVGWKSMGGAIKWGAYGLVLGGPFGAILGAATGAILEGAEGALEGEPDRNEKRLNETKFVNHLKERLKISVDSTSDQMVQILGKLFEEYDKNFKEKLGKIIEKRKYEYNKVWAKKREEDKIYAEKKKLEQEDEKVEREVGEIEKQLQEIKKSIKLEQSLSLEGI